MRTLTLKEAFQLSILKWEAIVKDGGQEGIHYDIIYPQIRGLYSNCGFCEYFSVDCIKCPLLINNHIDCFNDQHPFHKWQYNRSWINAKAVLNLILKRAREEGII